MKHKSSFVGETIAFSTCNKPFKPLGLPSGRVQLNMIFVLYNQSIGLVHYDRFDVCSRLMH
jgi:hypothetical protein